MTKSASLSFLHSKPQEDFMVKRVGILTLPLAINYGGIMQAVALSRYLTFRGYEVTLLDKRRPISRMERFALFWLERVPFQNIGGVRRVSQARKLHDIFIRRFIPARTAAFRSEAELAKAVSRHRLDAVIVGSDQVWRMDYLQDDGYREFFLSFVTSPTVRRIAYAASFGTGEWLHEERTATVRGLLSKFHAISVREDSGVYLCKSALGVTDCAHVLDPTLLIDPAFYDQIAAPSSKDAGKTLLTYLLDAPDRQPLLDAATHALGPDYSMASLKLKQRETIDLPNWLRSFMDADFVMTDSFHGTVFAILFRKPLIAIANTGRGADRFLSLLNALGLSSRLISVDEAGKVPALVATLIDYDDVHHKLSILRKSSEEFLSKALT